MTPPSPLPGRKSWLRPDRPARVLPFLRGRAGAGAGPARALRHDHPANGRGGFVFSLGSVTASGCLPELYGETTTWPGSAPTCSGVPWLEPGATGHSGASRQNEVVQDVTGEHGHVVVVIVVGQRPEPGDAPQKRRCHRKRRHNDHVRPDHRLLGPALARAPRADMSSTEPAGTRRCGPSRWPMTTVSAGYPWPRSARSTSLPAAPPRSKAELADGLGFRRRPRTRSPRGVSALHSSSGP